VVATNLSRSHKHEPSGVEEFMSLSTDCPDFFVDVFRWQAEHGREVALSRKKEILEIIEIFGPCEFHSHRKDEKCY
jgi:hypothetical protein